MATPFLSFCRAGVHARRTLAISKSEPCPAVNPHGRAMALPYEPAQMPPPSGWPKA